MSIQDEIKNQVDHEIIDFFDVGMTVLDRNFDIVQINKKALELLDIPVALAVPGKNLRDIIEYNAKRGEYGPGDVEEQVEERVAKYLQSGTYDFVRKRPNGRVLQIVGHRTHTGGFATTYTDITEIEKARHFLETENNELLKEIDEKNKSLEQEKARIALDNEIRNVVVENTHHGIALYDNDLKLVLCNKRFGELLGFPPEVTQPGTSIDVMFRYNAERGEFGNVDIEEAVAERVALAREFKRHKFYRYMKNGTVLEIIGKPVKTGFVRTYTDVTELVRSQKESQEAADKFKEIMNTSPIGIGISRIENGEIELINEPGAKMLGYETAEEALGESVRQNWMSENDRDEIIAEFVENGFVRGREIYIKDRHGNPFWGHISWQKITHNDEFCILFWLEDITEEKERKRRLVESEKMASLGGMVAGIAHEINTPIGVGITAVTHMMEEVKLHERRLEKGDLSKKSLKAFFASADNVLGMVYTNLRAAAQLVKSFKQVSVDQASEQPREILVSEYFESILQSLYPETKKANVDVQLTCVDDGNFYTYPGAISQIITNLISNSIKHGFEDKFSGNVELEVTGNYGESLNIRYQDDGVGISEEILPRVMDPFVTTKRGQGGSGLGLSIIYNIVTHKLDGTISLESVPGEGVLCYITIPKLAEQVSQDGKG